MSRTLNRADKERSRRGVTLVIVLAFVVLLTAVVVAFFGKAMSSRQVANTSSHQTKADLLARSALELIVGDLRTEITDPAASRVISTSTSTVYIPKKAENSMPLRSGNPAPVSGSDPVPNLVRRSVRNDTMPAPGRPSLASSVNSATDPAVDGRFVTPARWNSHYLIPAYNTDPADTTPEVSSGFVAPDWVLMTRNGAAVQTAVGSGPNALSNAALANSNFVVGRYAYAIYDEGGLLDMNVAGFPTPSTPPDPNGFTSTQVGRKGNLALADLTQLPTVRAPVSAADYLPQDQIDRLIGWRNLASARPGGAFPNFAFDATAASNWYANFARTNTTGFLKTYGTSTGLTDQGVLSRQHLLKLAASAGLNRNVLQFLGTFSRSLDQPSYSPDPSRPKIIGSSAPPLATLVDSYQGNNDGFGGDDQINPSFLSVRVGSSFTRLNGETAVVGDPLVKRRFALSHLALLASAPAVVPASAGQEIYDRFGLSRTSSSGPWIYNHGSSNIKTLSQVAAANREPDFAELLKASINVGSLGKAGPHLHNNQGNYQYTLDVSVDYQILQIMANLIDQYDTDSYPTVVQIAAGAVNRKFWGIEDLPYFYRYHLFSVVTRLPSPVISKTESVTFPTWTPGHSGAAVTFNGTREIAGASAMTDAGEAVLMYVPSIWNPNDPNTVASSSSNRPMALRITATTQDPAAQTPVWQIGAQSMLQSTPDFLPRSQNPVGSQAALTTATTATQFSDNGGLLFREPSLLWKTNYPTGSSLSSAGTVTEVNTGKQYLGIIAGRTPISMTRTFNFPAPQPPATVPTAGPHTYIFQGNQVQSTKALPPGAYEQITFSLQYQDAAGNWITYDEKYPDLHGLFAVDLIVNKPDYSQESWRSPLKNNQLGDRATGYDPRTARFGVGTASVTSEAGSTKYVLEPTVSANFNTNTVAGHTNVGNSNFTVIESQRPRSTRGYYVNYSNPGMTSDPGKNPQMRFFGGTGFSASNGVNTDVKQWDGLWSQNNPVITTLAKDNATLRPFYYEDPDGIARRAMGAYADTNITAASTLSTCAGLPQATANTYASDNGVGTATSQSQSRPFILNRPFRSVAEMGYAFRGTPWKQIDFFTPESGDMALLDTFCVNEPPPDALVAGKVSLNTRQIPVLRAILAGAYRDEVKNLSSPPGYAASPLDSTEATNIAAKLFSTTSNSSSAAWRGPLSNISELVGRYIPSPGSTAGATDLYTFLETITNVSYTYSGFSAALDSTVFNPSAGSTPKIQRFREAGIRPLVDAGQTRVWNLLIDVIAQSGRYPRNAQRLDQFAVEGERRIWLHVAIDRFTGEVIDRQVEVVTE